MKKRIIFCLSIILGCVVFYQVIVSFSALLEKNSTYSIMVDGVAQTNFPAKGLYNVDVDCENAEGVWDYDNWKLNIENIEGNISCDVNFNTIAKQKLNSKIASLSSAGTMQGDGKVVTETNTYTKSNFSTVAMNYTLVSGTAMTNSSNNYIDARTTSGMTYSKFSPRTAGYYRICMKIPNTGNYVNLYKINTTNSLIKKVDTSGASGGLKLHCYEYGYVRTTDYIYVGVYFSSNTTSYDNTTVYFQSALDYKTGISYRYEGKDPNNYVWFNNELWRIVGVFDTAAHGLSNNLVKIIRNESLGSYVLDVNGWSTWQQRSLYNLLNTTYYGTTTGTCYSYKNYSNVIVSTTCDFTEKGLKDPYKSMIVKATWPEGNQAANDSVNCSGTPDDMFKMEKRANFASYVGIMCPSDYGYASLEDDCPRTTKMSEYNNVNCAGKNWIFSLGEMWTIAPYSDSSSTSLEMIINKGGHISTNAAYAGSPTYPMVFLADGVYVLDGDGSLDDPYIIAM